MITPVPKLRSTPRVVGQLALLVISACLIAVVLSGVAHADLDSYSTGDGHEGAVTVSTNSVLNYSAPINAAVSAGASSLTTAAGQTGATGSTSTTGSAAQTQFEANRLALVIQSTNYSGPGATSGSQADIDLSSNSVGRWELARISSVTGSIAAGMTVNFSSPLINSYSSTGAQIVAVPEFTTVQVNSARTWSANPWNGSNGGITAFLASGAVNMSASTSTITADGAGFRGGVAYNTGGSGCTQLDGTGGGGKGEGIVSGVYPGTSATYASRGNIANAGGGGDCENAGGGGGGNGGAGGKGGYAYDGNRDVGGYGGAKLTYSAFDHAVFGGGGGAGDANNNVAGPGGNGGGLVFMRAASLTGSGTISAAGAAGGNSANVGASDGAGGGGAGGVVYARFTGAASCTLVSAKGGAGGNEQSTGGVHGPGGGGAGGRLVLQSASGTCPTNIGNGVAGTTTGSGNSNRGSGPTSATDSTSSGATEAVSGGGGMSAPTAAVSTPADGAYVNSATPTITGTSSMSLGTVRITIDGAYVGAATTLANGNWTFATSTLTAGSHTYSVQPVYYGIAGTASSNRTLIVDTTAPSAPTVSSNRSGSVNVSTATITYTPAEGGGTMQCSPDGTTYTTCGASPVSLTGLTDGVKTYYVRQLDAAGNVGAASSVTWTVDTVAPAAPTVSSNRSGTTSQTTATITYSAAEGGGTMQCSTDGTSYTTCAASPVSLTGLSDGVKTYFVRQVDVAGNEGSVNSVTWTVDTAAPAAPTVSSNRSGSTNQTTATITYTAAEVGGTLECSSDGATYSNCAASPIALSGLTDGAKSYFVRQVDAAGNVGGVASVAWIVDTSAPAAPTVNSNRSGSTNETTATITYTAAEVGGTLECSSDGTTYSNCAASPIPLSGLTDGVQSYYVRQVDAAANIGAPASVSWTVDTAPPAAPTISSNRTGSTSATSASITYAAAEVGGTLECSSDGVTYATCDSSPISLSGLSDGVQNYFARQVDAAGNTGSVSSVTWTVDTAPPAAPTVSANRSGETNETSAEITYAPSEPGGAIECSTDGTSFAACDPSPVLLTDLADGSHTYYVRQIDAAGNVGGIASVSWIVDTAAPGAPSVASNRSGDTNETSATITYSPTESGGSVECSFNGGAYDACDPSPFSLSDLTDGPQSVSIRQADAAGNQGPATTVSWTVDTIAPAAPTVSANPSGYTTETSAELNFSAAEPGGTLECSTDGATYSVCASSPVSLAGLADGPYEFFVRQVDAAGNTGIPGSATWTVDTIDPLVAIDSPINKPFSNTAVQEIEFSASDENLASTECSIDGGAFAACVSAWVTPALGEGFHTLRVRATDEAGQASVASYEVTVDTVTPADPAIAQPTDGAHLNNPRPTVSGTAEPDALVKIFVDSLNVDSVQADGSGAWSWTPTSDLSDGPHTLAATASDAAENTSPGLNALTVTIDTIAPGVPTLTGPSAHSNNPESTVTFSAGPGTDSLECSFNDAPPAACPSSPLSLGELPDGNYTFTVTARDSAGNSSSNTLAWEIDTSAPAAPTITGGPIGQIASTSASFDFTGAEAGGTFKCQLDSAPAVTCTSPFDYTGLADGSYTFHVRQVDAAGNVSPERTRTWTVDTTPPPTPVVSGPSSPSGFTSATITFSDAEATVTFQCSVDGATAQPCTSPLALSSLADGTHTVEVRAYDAAGNGSAPETVTWDVDHSLFTADISGAPTGVVNTTGAALSLTATLPGSTFECSLDGAAFAACAATVNLSSLTEGEHTFSARAKNGPQTSAAVSRTWTVDLTNPSVEITSPLPGETTASEIDVTFSVTDANDVTSLTCKLDSGLATPCTSPLQLSGLANGAHTLTIVPTDAGGNANSAAVTWSVDDIAPAGPAILQPAANAFISDTTPLFVGTAEPNSTVRLYDGATLVATVTADGEGDWEWAATPPLSEGAHVFSATATDAYDNTSAHSPNRTITIDTEDPEAPTINAPSSGPINDATPLVTGFAEPLSTVHVYVDGDLVGQSPAAGDGSWSLNLTPALSDGNHAITAVAEDAAGNRSPDSDELLVEVDTAAPSVAITAPSANAHVGTASPEVSFSAEAGAATRCKLDAGSFDSCASPVLLSGLSEGIHTYTVEATDAAGNAATAVRTFTVDLTAPTASISGGPAESSQSNDETPTFTLTSDESGSFECSIDGGAYAPCTSPFSPTLGSPLDGPHTISVRAIDEAGNTSSVQTRSWTVDTQAPDAPSIDDPADNAAVQDTTPTIAGDPGSAEAGSSVDVYIDGTLSGTATAAGDGSWTYTPSSALTDNVYTFTAKARDAAGNASAVSNAVHIRVDASSPTAQITGKPSALTNSSQATFNFTADEPATFECRLDSGAFGACSAPTLLSGLADGEHTFFVRATDAGSNASPSEQWTWTIDTTPPVVTVSANSPAAGLSPTFSFSSNESGTTYKCRIDGSGVFATCSSPFNAPTLSAGSHTLELQYTDAAGNTGSKSVAFSVSDAPVAENPPNTGDGGESPPQVCTGDGDEPGVPANLSVVSATAKKNTVNFTTTSDKYILVRVSIYNGKKLVGTAVRANNPGKRIVAIKTKKALPKNKKFSIRLSAVTMTGGKSVADAQLATDSKGNATLLGANGQAGGSISGVVECAAEKGAKKVKVKVATALKVNVSVKKLIATAQASDYAVATFRVVQNGNTVARRVFLLKPNKKLKASLKLLTGKKLAKGNATVQISTCSVDGVWQLSKKTIAVK